MSTNEFVIMPGRHYVLRDDPDRIATVTDLFTGLDGTPVVAYDLWQPDYTGRPGSWGSTVRQALFRELYRPEGDDTTESDTCDCGHPTAMHASRGCYSTPAGGPQCPCTRGTQ